MERGRACRNDRSGRKAASGEAGKSGISRMESYWTKYLPKRRGKLRGNEKVKIENPSEKLEGRRKRGGNEDNWSKVRKRFGT